MWLDASDSSTITASGSNVTQWRDKSGNGAHIATPGTSPTTGNVGPNGLNVTDWNTSVLNTASAAVNMSNGAMTFFAVLKWDTINVDAAGICYAINTVPSLDINTFVFERRTTNRIQVVTGTGSGSFNGANFKEQYFSSSDTSSYHKIVVRRDRTNGLRISFDGSSQTLTTNGGTCPDANFLTTSTTAWKVSVGVRAGNASFDGKLAEMGIYNTAISDSDVTALETYLARWF